MIIEKIVTSNELLNGITKLIIENDKLKSDINVFEAENASLDYQCGFFEMRIEELEKENKELKNKLEVNK